MGKLRFSTLLPAFPPAAIAILELAPRVRPRNRSSPAAIYGIPTSPPRVDCLRALRLALLLISLAGDEDQLAAALGHRSHRWISPGWSPAFFCFLPVCPHDRFLALAPAASAFTACACRFWRIFELNMIGQFFSAFLLGTTGGDVFKIFYAARAVPERKAAVAFTVIVDRVIGMIALLLFGVALSITQLPLAVLHPGKQGGHRHLLSCLRSAGSGLPLSLLWGRFSCGIPRSELGSKSCLSCITELRSSPPTIKPPARWAPIWLPSSVPCRPTSA